jgi:adenylate cyclase, class 2
MGDRADTAHAPKRNIELKARDLDRKQTLATCRNIGAADEGELWQRDTYFAVPRGGLKLREQRPGQSHLIHFERADLPEERESRYRIAPVEDGEALLLALEAALGTRGTVEKSRHLFLWKSVRIHLDEVSGLGSFIELEAVAPAGSDLSYERGLVAELREAFGITDDRLCPTGYASQLGI